MIDWLIDHWYIIPALYTLYKVAKTFDQIKETLDSLHEDFRKVHHLDAIEELEMTARMPGPSPSYNDGHALSDILSGKTGRKTGE